MGAKSIALLVVAFGLGMLTSAAAEDVNAMRGVIRDARSGRAIAGVRVYVRDAAGAEYRLTTDRSGRYGVLGLSAGPVTVTAEKTGYDSVAGSCRLFSGASARLYFTIEVGSIDNIDEPQTCSIDPSTSDRYIIQ